MMNPVAAIVQEEIDCRVNFLKNEFIPGMIAATADTKTYHVMMDRMRKISPVALFLNQWQGISGDRPLTDFLDDPKNPHDDHETYFCYLWQQGVLFD